MTMHRDLILAIWNIFTPFVIMYDKKNNFVIGYSIGKIKSITDFQNYSTSNTGAPSNKKPTRHTLLSWSFRQQWPWRNWSLMNWLIFTSLITMFTSHNTCSKGTYVLEIGTPGWIFGKHPLHHDKDELKIMTMTQSIQITLQGPPIPSFHLALCTVGHTENNGTFMTTAIIIHVEEKLKQTLHQMLKKTYKEIFYVPWRWKSSNPNKHSNAAAFWDAMIAQNIFVTNLWFIPIHGIPEKQWWY